MVSATTPTGFGRRAALLDVLLRHRLCSISRTPANVQNLADRVKSEIFRDADARTESVNVNVEASIVYLRGEADAEQAEKLVAAAHQIDGVRGVENMVHGPGEPAPHKRETAEETRLRVAGGETTQPTAPRGLTPDHRIVLRDGGRSQTGAADWIQQTRAWTTYGGGDPTPIPSIRWIRPWGFSWRLPTPRPRRKRAGPLSAADPPRSREEVYEAAAGGGGCSASWSFFVSSSESEVLITVPPYSWSAAIALSGVACSITMNSADVPGCT